MGGMGMANNSRLGLQYLLARTRGGRGGRLRTPGGAAAAAGAPLNP